MIKVGVLLIVFISIVFSIERNERIYAINIKGDKQIVNRSEKTIVILTNSIECSGCESYLNEYIQDHKVSDSIRVVVIAKYASNAILRRQRYDYYHRTFHTSNDVLFLTDSSAICEVKYSSFITSDFPVILLINNKSEYCKYYKFTSIASEYKGHLKGKREFDKAFSEFQD